MAHRLVKLAEYDYQPAVSEIVAQPARYVTVTRTVRVTVSVATPPSSPGGTIGFDNTWGESVEYGAGWAGGSDQIAIPTEYPVTTTVRYVTIRETKYIPPVQGRPGRDETITNRILPGWDSGATSADEYLGNLRLVFDFGEGSVGALCGITSPAAVVATPNAVRHGLRFIDGVVQVVEAGVVRATTVFDPEAEISITRVGTQVTYRVGGWEYLSGLPSEGAVVVSACLYASGDYVENPAVFQGTPLAVDIPWGWMDHDTAFSLAATVPWGWRVAASISEGTTNIGIPLDVVASDESQGWANVDIGGPTIHASDDVVVVVVGVVTQYPMVLSVQGSTIGNGRVEYDPGGLIFSASDYQYGEVQGDVGGVLVLVEDTGEPEGSGSASEGVVMWDRYIVDPVIYAHIDGALQVGTHIDVLLALDAALVDYLVAGDSVDASIVFSALLASRMQVSDHAGAVRAAVLQYATNLLTGAVGRYEGFDFRGFVRSGMQTYGWKPDGLYRMAYAEDTGETIQAMIDFAAEDFDTTSRKSIRALFFGADTDGALYARLVDDNDCEATYRVIPHGDTQRANPAQRPTSRFWRLRLEIVDATTMDLDNVEWKVATTGRRTRS